ncbi:aromatic compound dioxygenase [Hypoxylon fragiforme]|uniref:aromatic compound dioxygenase n=1 Tax=Hypoxylon fragiforme TaxID=63214 RepID=UPI0020C6FCD9|nr:aromatic compound dioxygenase [Hypoxylon fragiforme]KAI2606995.1 aromatic compound dioxygenase [Hypoxylon fragiforme]
MRFASSTLLSLALLAGSAVAHPGHDISEEIRERREFLSTAKRTNLDHCAPKLKARGVEKRNVLRREALLEKARAKRGLNKKRDLETVLATDHNKTSLGYTTNTDPAVLFAGYNACLLTPEVTQGPYYVGGEYVRENIAEEQAGVDTILDYQVIDINTCEPVPEVYLEMWHCNATGVYGGIVASGNGDSSDETNINNTWLRGIQKTNSDGVAQFETIFPGHYTSRATHVHIMIHQGATLLANSTLGNSNITASHVGQAFFDQDLITEVELTAPYNTNTQELTTNADDGILGEETATDGVDPFYEYTLLGDDVSSGIFGWIAFGINATATQDVTPAAFYYAEGGVANPNAGAGGGSGGPPPSGNGNSSSAPASSSTASA